MDLSKSSFSDGSEKSIKRTLSIRLHTLGSLRLFNRNFIRKGTSSSPPIASPLNRSYRYRSNQGKNSGCTKTLDRLLPRKFNFFRLFAISMPHGNELSRLEFRATGELLFGVKARCEEHCVRVARESKRTSLRLFSNHSFFFGNTSFKSYRLILMTFAKGHYNILSDVNGRINS